MSERQRLNKRSASVSTVNLKVSQTATSCAKCPFRKMPTFREFTKEELSFVEDFKVGELTVQAGATLFLDGHDSPHLYTILQGWIMRYKMFSDGRRQVLNFGFPGDFIGLQSGIFDKMDHSVEALTDVSLCVFERDQLWRLFQSSASLAYDVTWLAAREEAILASHLANVGQSTAYERLAYIISYLFARGRRAGLIHDRSLKVPVTQEHLADAMGLSVVHTNKTLKKLKAAGLIDWTRGQIHVEDDKALAEIADFDPESSKHRPFI